MSGAALMLAFALAALVRVWLASLMSPGRAAPDLLLYFAAPATPAPRLRGALAKPSLREGLGMGCGKRRNPSPLHHQLGERSRQWGAWRSEVKGETRRSLGGGHERSRVPHCLLWFHRANPNKTTTVNQPTQALKRTTP